MPFWDWHQPLKLRRNSQDLRHELLLSIAQLDVFTTALRAEINQRGNGDTDRDTPPTTTRPDQ